MSNRYSIVASILVGLFIMSLSGSTGLMFDDFNGDYSEPRLIDNQSNIATMHDPIVIGSNSDFATYGFEGNGSSSEPYIIENLDVTSDDDCIRIGNTTAYFVIRNSVLRSTSGISGSGISLHNVSYATVESCTTISKYFGIIMMNVNDSLLYDISAMNGWYGIRVNISNNVAILNSLVEQNFRTGVEIRDSQNCTVQGVSILDNVERGMYVIFSTTCNITDNTIMNNQGDGIYLYFVDDCLIEGNGIYDNGAYGIVITLGNDNRIFDNGFGWNALSALDNGNNNTWDFESTNSGNYWSDFEGIGNYSIAGSADSVDRYPDYIILVSQPPDNEYVENTITGSISWNCQAYRPNRYRILSNSVLVEERSWNGSNIEFSFDLSEVGLFNYTIILLDDVDHFVSDSVSITVWDLTVPTINHPMDIEYLEGFTGSIIIWSPYDTQPSMYTIFRNNVKLVSAGWDGEAIQIGIDGLNPGTYYYKIVVYDLGGNSVDDIVKVTVLEDQYQTSLPTTTPITTPTIVVPQNPWYSSVLGGLLFLIGSIITLIAVLINTRYYFKRRES